MKKNIQKLSEVLDKYGNLIGANDKPAFTKNTITKSKKITDYNANVARQPYTNDALGLFGVYFWEGENSGQFTNDIQKLFHEYFSMIIDNIINNASRSEIKNYKTISDKDFDDLTTDDKGKIMLKDYNEKIVELIKTVFESIPQDEEQLEDDKNTITETLQKDAITKNIVETSNNSFSENIVEKDDNDIIYASKINIIKDPEMKENLSNIIDKLNSSNDKAKDLNKIILILVSELDNQNISPELKDSLLAKINNILEIKESDEQ